MAFISQVLHTNTNVTEENERAFEELIRQCRIDDVKNRMDTRREKALACIGEYRASQHEIMKRRDKPVYDEKGEYIVDWKKVARLPVPYQKYINEIALVFLFGKPVLWQQTSEGTDEAYNAFTRLVEDIHFDDRIRECKRVAGAETESAALFRLYKDEEGAKLQLRTLANSKGDTLYTRFDQYENLVAFAWGYNVRAKDNTQEERLDIYTADSVYACANVEGDEWRVEQSKNLVGKIPVIYFRQEKEWADVEQLIERLEDMASRKADTNDYFGDPLLLLNSDIVANLPDKNDTNKTLVTNATEGGVDQAAKFLTWDSAGESKKDELAWLEDQILSKSFTPDIKLDTLKSLGNLSGKALRTVMLLASIKADRRKETYNDMIKRAGSLLRAIIGNVLDVRLKSQCNALRLKHTWQEPFGEDVASALDNITKAVDAGILSEESAVEISPLTGDPETEKRRLDEEARSRSDRQASLFGAEQSATA